MTSLSHWPQALHRKSRSGQLGLSVVKPCLDSNGQFLVQWWMLGPTDLNFIFSCRATKCGVCVFQWKGFMYFSAKLKVEDTRENSCMWNILYVVFDVTDQLKVCFSLLWMCSGGGLIKVINQGGLVEVRRVFKNIFYNYWDPIFKNV